MKLLVLGASGGCGRWVTRLAVDRGHDVTALVRPATEFDAPSSVRVVRDDVLAESTLERSVAGQDAVVCCIGLKRAVPMNPWSRLISPADLSTRVAELCVRALASHGVTRFVGISAAGVRESRSDVTWPIRLLITRTNVRFAYRDLAGMEEVYAASDLDWIVARPATLVGGPPSGRAREIRRYGLLSRISRGDVAEWLLDAVERPGRFERRAVMIASA